MGDNALPFNAPINNSSKGKTTLRVEPRSGGNLSLPDQYSTKNRPNYSIKILAINEDLVEYKEEKLGNEDKYTVVISVTNKNDSPAFITLLVS